jgi:signal transduction histidine kinase
VAHNRSLGSRRALVLYLGAVVGPTLVVLTLGIGASLRQMEATDTLRLTTRRLQEARIVEEVERALTAHAAAALGDAALGPLAAVSDDTEPARLDELRAALPPFRTRHPIAREVFVLEEGELRYPRLEAPLPRAIDASLATEPRATRAPVERAWAAASRLEAQRAHMGAATAYLRARDIASSRSVQALTLAAAARCTVLAGDPVRAAGRWRELATEYPDTYNLADRPHALVAAIELARIGERDRAWEQDALRDLRQGRWSVTPEQLAYFEAELGAALPPAEATPSPYRDGLRLAVLVRDRLGIPLEPAGTTGLRAIGAGDDVVQVAYQRLPAAPTRVVGIVVDLAWLHGTLLRNVAEAIAPGDSAHAGVLDGDHAPFRTILPGWRLAVAAPALPRPWLRPDLVAFAAATVVVLGVLVMGVLLLRRDVSRETDLNRMRADLVSGVSHELKAPLSVIRVYAETIDEVSDATADERRQFTAAIIQETDRLHRLVSDVVDFSRIQQGQRPYHLVPGSLAAVVAGAAERSRRYADLHGFTLDTAIDRAVPPVRLDVSAVEQAVLNLVDNAFKYSGDARHVAMRLRCDDYAAVVEVQDRGPGIAADEQARIFERFHRGRHGDRGGYGLGLYLVRHIMDAHGGRVEVESEPGQGSVFRLRFPFAQEGDAQGAAG